MSQNMQVSEGAVYRREGKKSYFVLSAVNMYVSTIYWPMLLFFSQRPLQIKDNCTLVSLAPPTPPKK